MISASSSASADSARFTVAHPGSVNFDDLGAPVERVGCALEVSAHGDVTDPASLRAAARGCEVVIHAAGRMGASPAVGLFVPVNVTGTGNMLTAASEAGVRRFIYLGAAMSLLGSARPITGADESWPLQQPHCSGYAASKTRADQAVQAANGTQMATLVIRPGWVWGTADDVQTASFVQAVYAGQMRLIDGGRHRIVATHMDNVIHAVRLAIYHGVGGRGYYVFDEGSTTIRDFLAGLLQAYGLTLPESSVPGPVAAGLARALDAAWRITRRPGDPPITRMIVELNRGPFLVSDARARQELGYLPVITRQQGLQRLRGDICAPVQSADADVSSASETSGARLGALSRVAGSGTAGSGTGVVGQCAFRPIHWPFAADSYAIYRVDIGSREPGNRWGGSRGEVRWHGGDRLGPGGVRWPAARALCGGSAFSG